MVVRLTGRGTHEGTFLGVAPTGRTISITGLALARCAEGRIQAGWNSLDLLGLLQQLGGLPIPT